MTGIKEHFINDQQLPLVIEPDTPGATLDELKAYLKSDNDALKDKLLKYGGLLLRGFPINNSEDFITVIESLGLGPFVDYIGGGSPRVKVKGHVYTSTEAPPGIKIQLHNEMSFADNYPKHIYFYCETPSSEGGETFIGDARKIYETVNPKLKKEFVNRGLKYVSRYYYKSKIMDTMNKIQRGHKTWIDVFETEDKKEVEQKCAQNNIGIKWNPNDWLEISRLRPALLEHPQTKETVWFNQPHLFDYNPRFLGWLRYVGMKLFYFRKHMLVDEVFYGDGEKISRKDIYHLHDVLDQNSVYFPWQKGDVMILDNILTMHGRAPFKGKRKVLTAMTN